MLLAHSGLLANGVDGQPLLDHSSRVSRLAAALGAPLGIAKAAGLAHDLGKYDPRIQAYLRGQGVSVDHSTAGATVLSDPAKSAQDQAEAARDCLATEAVVYCILGHQARLPDRSRSPASRISGFARDHLDPAWHEDLSLDFEGVCAELFAHVTPASMAFDLSVAARMVFSCLVEADFLDT